MARYQMLNNVRHDGRKLDKGSECPKDLAAIMVQKGLAVEIKDAEKKPEIRIKKKQKAD